MQCLRVPVRLVVVAAAPRVAELDPHTHVAPFQRHGPRRPAPGA
jgi:hypothetical protein